MSRLTNSPRVAVGGGCPASFHTRTRRENHMEVPTPAYTSGKYVGGKMSLDARIGRDGVGETEWSS